MIHESIQYGGFIGLPPNHNPFYIGIIPARDPKQCGGGKRILHDDDDDDDDDDEEEEEDERKMMRGR